MTQAWSRVGSAQHTTFGVAGTYSVNVPSGVQAGDLLVLFAGAFSNSTPGITDPTTGTWTTRVNETVPADPPFTYSHRWRFWDRIAGGSEPASYSVTVSGTGVGGTLFMLAYRNTGPFDGYVRYGSTNFEIPLSNPTFSITRDDSLFIAVAIRHDITGGHTDDANHMEDTSFTKLLDHINYENVMVADRNQAAGVTGSVTPFNYDVAPVGDADTEMYSIAYRGLVLGEASLQGVATQTADAVINIGSGTATLQGVASLTPDGSLRAGGEATLQGVAKLTPEAQGAPALDFTVYDMYIESDAGTTGYIGHEDEQTKGSTSANPIRAPKQDVGQNPFEQRPEFGDTFGQGDFSHGADQDYYHHEGRDARKYLASEGFDISEPGVLRHLRTMTVSRSSASIGRITQAGGVLFVVNGQRVDKSDGAFPGSWTQEDPSGADADQNVHDVTSRGAEIFACINTATASVRIRSSAGTWSRYQPDGATDLSVGIATRIKWLKDRLIVVGGTNSRSIYEVVASSTPTAMKTLPEGWTFEGIFEAGAFIYAPAVNANAGLSRVHIFGLNSGATALEDKGSVPIPRGELIYTGLGDPGGVFLGGGRATTGGGYDPVFYQAVQSDNGFLQLLKISQGEGAGSSDCSVRGFETLGDAIVMSWSLGAGALTGARTGIAWYHLGRQAFALHLKKNVASAALVTDIIFYKGRICFSINGDGLYYEDTSTYVSQAYLISSIGDWGSAGLKTWDEIQVSHRALPSGTSVVVQYSSEHPEENLWSEAFRSNVAGSLGDSGRLSNLSSRLFAVKVVSNAAIGGATAPEPQSFSVRSNPTRAQPEFVLTRFVRLLAKDRKDRNAPVTYRDPISQRIALQQLLDSWVTVYEPGITWTAFVKDVADAEPTEPFLNATSGERPKEAYLVRLDMIATGGAA